MASNTVTALDFRRVCAGEYASGDYTVRREDTTFGMKRAGNPMWFVYFGAERLGRHTTLDRAKRHASKHAADSEPAPVVSLPLPSTGTVVATPEHDGVVTMTRADWDTIAAILRDMRVTGAVSGPQDEALASMSFVECTLVGA